MKLVISHMSAIETCSSLAASGRKAAQPCKIRSLHNCVCTEREFKTVNASASFFSQLEHVDILVPDASRRFASQRIVRHSWTGPLPDGAFYQMAADVFVTSPEFSLLLMSKSLPFNELIRLTSELCSRYATSDSERGFVDRPPLTSPAKITKFLNKLGSVSGSAKLKRALRYAVVNARSPMETALGIIIGMPPRLGGFGLGAVELNHRIDLEGEAAMMAGRSYVELDFFFPGHNVSLEYESNAFHACPEKVSSDARRNNTLRALGLTVINLTWDQVRNPILLEGVMRQTALALRKKLRTPSANGAVMRSRLCADLLPLSQNSRV